MSDETIKVDLSPKAESADKEQSADVDFKVDLSKPPVEKKEEDKKTEVEDTSEKKTEVEETKEDPKLEDKVKDKKQTKEEILSAYLTDKYELDIKSLEDVLSNKEKKQVSKLPEEVEKYLEYNKETNRGLKDYMNLQQDLIARMFLF